MRTLLLKPRFRRVLGLAVLGVPTGLCAGEALGADRSWVNVNGGTFTVASNWSGSAVPGALDRAFFSLNDPGYTVTFTASVANDELHVTNDDVLFNLGGTRTYTLNDATSSAVIGSGGGTARVNVESGTLLCTGGARVGHGPGSTGFVTVINNGMLSTAGAGSTSLIVGAGGDGQVDVFNTGRLSTTDVQVGVDSGEGVVNLLGLGTWTNSGAIRVGTRPLGSATGGRGSVLIASSTLTTNALVVGDADGVGTLTIHSDAHVTVGSLSIGRAAVGTATTSDATLVTTNTTIGQDATGVGAFHAGSITTLSTWTNSGTLTVGARGRGTLTLNGVTATSTGTVTLGELETGRGFARLDDSSADWTTGTMIIGGRGVGTLEISNNAQVDVNGPLHVGRSGSQAAGTLRVEGSSSELRATGAASFGGSGGATATVSVTNGALLATGAATLGAGTGGATTFVLTGPDSEWQVGGNLQVAATGSATLSINAGAEVNATGTLAIGATGTLRLDGGTLDIGGVSNGIFGVFQFNAGTLRVDGPFTLGASNGLLGLSYIADPARTLETNGTLTISPTAVLVMAGGRVNATNVLNQGVIDFTGSAVPLFGGIVNEGLIRGDGRIRVNLINNAAGRVRVAAGQMLDVDGGITNNPGGRVDVLGGEVSADVINNLSTIALDDGALTAGNSLLNTATGVIAGRGNIHTGTAGFDNFGSVNLSAGFTDVTGADFVNKPAGKTIVTGGSTSTFFLPVTNEAGSEFRVSTNSTAVFFGPVTGLGAFTGTGTVVFEGLTTPGAIDRGGTTVVESSGSLTVERVRESALVLRGAARVLPNGSSAATSRVTRLDVDGGRLDLTNNDLVIDYSGASPIQTVRQQIRAGFNDGAWDGSGIATSSGTSSGLGLGYAEAGAIFTTFPATFSGQSVDNTSVLVAFVRFGDANLDGAVNLQDFNRLAANFGAGGAVWTQGDFNYDGAVNLQDFNRLAANFGQSAAGPDVTPQDWANLAAVVPEPGLALPVMAGLILLRRRR